MAKADQAPPALTNAVIVITPQKIAGQNEHAAVVIGVESDDVVHVLLTPAGIDPYRIIGVPHVKTVGPGSLAWRWPSRRT